MNYFLTIKTPICYQIHLTVSMLFGVGKKVRQEREIPSPTFPSLPPQHFAMFLLILRQVANIILWQAPRSAIGMGQVIGTKLDQLQEYSVAD